MTTADVGELVAGATRVVLAGRLVAAALTLLVLPEEQRRSGLVVAAVVVAAVAGSVALHRWQGVGSLVVRHPIVLGVDAVPIVVVLGLVGDASPWLLAVLSTAVLAGLFYGPAGAAVFGTLLIAGHALALVIDPTGTAGAPGVFGVLVVPLLVAGAAAAAASVRHLLQRVAASAAAARAGVARAATAEERARVARELHDRVAKTLHGVALTAEALQGALRTCPERAAALAAVMAEAALGAIRESREVLADLRADQPEQALADTVRQLAATAAGNAGAVAAVDVQGEDLDGRLPADVRYEVVAVLREALDNAVCHARPSRLDVLLHGVGDRLELTVRDDGVGMPQPVDPARLSSDGHHGLLGMCERARRCGGRLDLATPDGGGTELRLCVPIPSPEPITLLDAPAPPPARLRSGAS